MKTLKIETIWLAILLLTNFLLNIPYTLALSNPNVEQQAVYQLANECFVIQSPTTKKYLTKYKNHSLIDNGLRYQFSSNNSQNASQFFLKATSLGNFMLTDEDSRFLASNLFEGVTAGRYPGKFANWAIKAKQQNNGEFVFQFYNHGFKKLLKHNIKRNRLYFNDPLNIKKNWSEDYFKLIPSDQCLPYPEITTNVVGDPKKLKGNIKNPVRGYIDPHTHITAYKFMGGKVVHGSPYHPWGVTHALNNSKISHGNDGVLDIIGNLRAFNDVNYRYDTRGWPQFTFWPNHQSMTHMAYYYKWVERTYLSGLRIMVTHLVENKALCTVQSIVNPINWNQMNNCDTMDSIRSQAKQLYALQDYIDAQSKGPGRGFFRIVKTPEEARSVIANGQMAVIMGVEASQVLNCGLQQPCSEAIIDSGLNELHNLGVRILFPTHKFDNQFGGSRVENGFINIGQFLSTERFFETKACDENTQGAKFTSGFPLLNEVPVIKDILANIVKLNPQYDENIAHCNKHGLTNLGEYLINSMIDKKMIIDLDHMSHDTAVATLQIANVRNYSGMISSHSWMHNNAQGGVHENTKKLIRAGGFVAPYNNQAYGINGAISNYLEILEATPYVKGVGLGTDMNGLGTQPGPRPDSQLKPLKYPYTSEFGLTFYRQQSGERTFDLNNDGMAHYGMLADHLEDIKQFTNPKIYNAIMNSAEAFLQMWERAVANNSHSTITIK